MWLMQYDVYKHPVIGYEAVKQGFSWPAFFFNWLWAFVKKMWIEGLVIIGVYVIVYIIAETCPVKGGPEIIIIVVQLGISIFIGKMGNEWRRDSLKKRGFEHLKTVFAESPDAAIAIVARPSGASEGT